MKILLVTPMLPRKEPDNAAFLVMYASLTSLAPRHRMTLVTVAGPNPADRGALDDLRALGVDVQVIWRSEPYGMNSGKQRLLLASAWLRSRYPRSTIWFRDIRIQQILDRLLTEQHFDLIQVEDNAAGIYRYPPMIPTILVEHEVRRPRPIQWHRRPGATWIQWVLGEANWRRWWRYQRDVWCRFARIQVFTPDDGAALRCIAPMVADRVRINPLGIEIPPAADPARVVPGTVVFVGGFGHQPNVDAALWLGMDIMPRLRLLCPRVRLILVGSHPPASVQALACHDLRVTGRVPRIEPFLEQAAVVLAPVRVGGGMRMKVLQAMAMGKAVVTTPMGAAGLGEGGQLPLVIAEDAEGIARATAALLDMPEACRDLGMRARSFVAGHRSLSAYIQRLETIYAELVPNENVASHADNKAEEDLTG